MSMPVNGFSLIVRFHPCIILINFSYHHEWVRVACHLAEHIDVDG